MSASTVAQNLAATQQLPINRLDAQLLMLHVLGRTAHERAWLLAHDNDPLDASLHAVFVGLAARRAAGEPLAYLTGFRAFYGLQVAVSPDVLIPRPDTETLVDWALALLALATPEVPPNAAKPETPRVLDLGTGSGAIALALKHQLPNAQVTATDFSLPALAMAQANAARLGLDIHFLHSNWLAGLQASQISHISPG